MAANRDKAPHLPGKAAPYETANKIAKRLGSKVLPVRAVLKTFQKQGIAGILQLEESIRRRPYFGREKRPPLIRQLLRQLKEQPTKWKPKTLTEALNRVLKDRGERPILLRTARRYFEMENIRFRKQRH